MKFTVNFKADNAAFENDRDGAIVDILREIADRVEKGDLRLGQSRTILDENGNDIGRFKLKMTDDD